MAIFLNGQQNEQPYIWDEIEGEVCFMCHGHLFDDIEHSTGGLVFWHGANGFLVLHQCCAEKLGINLIQDARILTSRVGMISKLNHDFPQELSAWYVVKE